MDGDPEALLALLVDPSADKLVLCSHGELIGTVLERLVGRALDTGGQLDLAEGFGMDVGGERRPGSAQPLPPAAAAPRHPGQLLRRGGSAATSRPLRCQACSQIAAAGSCGGED